MPDEFVDPFDKPEEPPVEVPEVTVEIKPPHEATDADALPSDIEEIWGGGRLDGTGQLAAITARTLIDNWGLDVFRTSAIHRVAQEEALRDSKLTPVRAAFVKQHAKSKPTDDTNPNPEDPR